MRRTQVEWPSSGGATSFGSPRAIKDPTATIRTMGAVFREYRYERATYLRWAACLVIAMFAGVLYFGGLQGTDQYWYYDNTERLASGGGVGTHAVYPGPLLRGDFDGATPIVHNTPLLHLNAFLARSLGPLWSWKLTNVLWLATSMLAVGALVLLHASGSALRHASSASLSLAKARRLVEPDDAYRWACAAALLFVTSPLAIWLGANLVQEAFYAALAVMIVCLVLYCGFSPATSITLALLLAVGSLSHPLFVILAVAVMLDAVVQRASWLAIAIVALATATAIVMKPIWFPSSFAPGIVAIITASAPDGSNVLWHLRESLPELDVDLLYRKLVAGLLGHLTPLISLPLQATTLAGLMAGAWLGWRCRGRYARLLFYSGAMYACWFGVAVLTQPQIRYQMLVLPFAITLLTLAMLELRGSGRGRLAGRVLLAIGVAGLLVSVQVLFKVRADVERDAQAVATHMRTLDKLPDDARLVVQSRSPIGHYLALYQALEPRKIMFLDPFELSSEARSRAFAAFDPDVLISVPDLGEGLEPGEPDLVLREPTGRYHTLNVHYLDPAALAATHTGTAIP